MNKLKTTKYRTAVLLVAVAVLFASVGWAASICHHDFGEEVPLGKTEDGYLYRRTCSLCGLTEEHTYAALLTFIDDDAKTQAILHWETIMDATGIKMTSALIPGKIGDTTDYDTWSSYAGWDLLGRLKEKGVDYVHHTYSHKRLGTFTEAQLHEDFQASQEILTAHNIHSNLLVYPFYNHNATVRQVASVYFDAAFGGERDDNSRLDAPNYAIKRLKITNPKKVKTVTFPNGKTAQCQGTKNTGLLKRELRQAVKEGDWLVYVTHAYDSPAGKFYFDQEAEQAIIQFCRYAQSRGDVKIVTATEGFVAAQPIR